MAATTMLKSPRKRPSSSHFTGPNPKKPHLEGHSAIEKSVPKSPKRTRPVTQPLPDDDDDDDEEEEDEDSSRLSDAEENLSKEESFEDGMPVDEGPVRNLSSTRESHKAQKILLDQRRAQKRHSDLLVAAKRHWTLLQRKNLPTSERQTHVKALMHVIRGNVKDIVFKHDASRIIQTVVKYGSSKEREEVAKELRGHYKELAQSKYARFLVTKLLRFCPSQRLSILLEFRSRVVRMLLHREASSILADAFELYANAYERAILVREFYGKEATLFSTTTGSDDDKERAKRGLKGLLEGGDPDRKRRLMADVKTNLVTIFDNPDKGAITHAVVHRVLWEYLCAINDIPNEAEQEKHRREIFDSCQDVLAEMVHTKDGSRAVREFLARGSAKDRKQILKVVKPHIERMCQDDEAQLVLFTALDVVDDTKLLSKAVVAPIATSHKLYDTPQGRRSLLHLIVPRSRRHFTPSQISCIAETDSIRALTSKKDAESRIEEVRKAASEELLTWIEKDGGTLVRETSGCLVLAEVMLFADGDKSEASRTILKALVSQQTSGNGGLPDLIDLPHTSRLYKTLLQGGHYNHKSQLIDRVPPTTWNSTTFATSFIQEVGKEATVRMCLGTGNGAFVVSELVVALDRESSAEDDTDRTRTEDAKKALRQWFDNSIIKEIEQGEAKGKKVLLEKLASLCRI